MTRIIIQGWRFIPHSYALVNQFQCLAMLRRPELELFHQDVPYVGPHWRSATGLLDPASEELLRGIPPPRADQPADVTYRIAFPYDLSDSASPRTVVFATSETLRVPPAKITGQIPLPEALARSSALIVTPSNWSRRAFLNTGAEPDRVRVVPHGVDPSIFHPTDPVDIAQMRRHIQWENSFVFAHIVAMTDNKNIPHLLRAFAIVAERYPQTRLVLKGLDAVYPSGSMFQRAYLSLTQAQQALIQPRLMASFQSVSFRDMARIYQCADAYVAPYAAEGFNLPVLEAAACGLPVNCTAGGPTDDFTTPQYALPVAAQLGQLPGESRVGLLIDFDSLVHQMLRIIEDHAYRATARRIAPAHIAQYFSRDSAVDRLLKVLLKI